MRFASLFLVAVTAVATVSATLIPPKLHKGNHYGAPIPPWVKGCKPGWYFGDHYGGVKDHSIPWLKDKVSSLSLVPSSSPSLTPLAMSSCSANSWRCSRWVTSAARSPTTHHPSLLHRPTAVETMGITRRCSMGLTVRCRHMII